MKGTQETMSVNGKVALVTGGASGMGRASALLLASRGAKVVIADWNESGARTVHDEIAAQGGTAMSLGVDVGDSSAVDRLVQQAVESYGRLDILMHGAGICPRKHVLEMSDDEWRDVMRINLDGSFYVTRAAGRLMAEQRSGTMILITSDRGVHGSIDYAHYAASKGGLIALTKSLALALGKYGVTVNALNPGITDTPLARAAVVLWEEKMQLDVLGKYSLPEEIAEVVLFLAGTAGRFMTGQIVGTRMRYGA